MNEKKLTVDRFLAIPSGGTATFRYQTTNDMMLGQIYASTLAKRFDAKITTKTDTDTLTLTVFKYNPTKTDSHE